MKKFIYILLLLFAFTAKSQNLIYQETFEGPVYFPLSGTLINKTRSLENCNKITSPYGSVALADNTTSNYGWTLTKVTSPVFQGNKAVKFELKKDMPLVGSANRHRSEVVIIKGTEDSRFTPDIWYSFAILFPRMGMEYDGNSRDIINQWFEDANSDNTIKVDKDRVYFEATPNLNTSTKLRFDLFGQTITKPQSNIVLNMVPIPKGEWHEFAFHFVHSKTDGLVDIYRDGVLIHKIRGRTMHYQYPKWKLGLYKADMLESQHYSRVLYFDNIRVGKKGSTLGDMMSGSQPVDTIPVDTVVTPPPPPVIQSAIKSFTLINAGIDKDYSAITEGGIYSLSNIGSTSLSIRANCDSVTSVKFELSGAKSYTYTDKYLPFALKGDNGYGNYYYFSFIPGNYTLKATPYRGTIAGATATINFNIIK